MFQKPLAAVAVFLFMSSAGAVPVVWQLNDVTIADGSIATGTFTFDADTSTYSNISITSTGTNGWGSFYDQIAPGAVSLADQVGFNDGGTFFFGLIFDTGLTNSGGNVGIYVSPGAYGASLEATCVFECQFPDPETFRSITGGYVSAVPLPAAVWLFGSALAGLGWMRKKRTI